jgi:nitrogen PTS system EIIA component
MQLAEIIKCNMIWPELTAKTKLEVIRELSDDIASQEDSLDGSTVASILMERERLGSTGIQDGIAIPHGKVPGLEEIVVACGRSLPGIDFDAHDGQATHLFFVLLAPEDAAGQHLKVLAKLSRLLKEATFRDRLMKAKTAEEMHEAIAQEDEKL